MILQSLYSYDLNVWIKGDAVRRIQMLITLGASTPLALPSGIEFQQCLHLCVKLQQLNQNWFKFSRFEKFSILMLKVTV